MATPSNNSSKTYVPKAFASVSSLVVYNDSRAICISVGVEAMTLSQFTPNLIAARPGLLVVLLNKSMA
jgi:hypothetical protein